jgi:hypothetical protein
MLTFAYNLPLQQGASLDKTLTYRAGSPAVPVDLTGCTAWLVVRLRNKEKTEVLRLTTEGGGLTLGGAAGTLRIQITRAQSRKFKWDDAAYTCHLQYPNGFVQRFLEGLVDVSHCDD